MGILEQGISKAEIARSVGISIPTVYSSIQRTL